MGQPHHAYLIARFPNRDCEKAVKGWTESVCVAAIYHNMCDGLLPLKSIHRFVTLAKQPDNAEIIREELRLISESRSKPPKHVPSRYLARLLSCAFNFGLEEEKPYCRKHLLDEAIESITLEIWDSGNQEGHTIIDVTNPENCSYCLVAGSCTFRDEEDPYVVLTPEEYARAWYDHLYPEPESEEEIDDAFLDFDDWNWHPRRRRGPTPEEIERKRKQEAEIEAALAPLEHIPYMNVDALCDVWPTAFPRRIWFRSEPPSSYYQGHAPRVLQEPTPSIIPPLMDLILGRAVERVLDTDDAEGVESLLRLQPTPFRAKIILEALRSLKSPSSFTDASINLLAELIQEDWDGITLDLSYLALKKGQVLSLLKHFSKAELLKISHNPFVKIDTIHDVLKMMPHVRRLVLLNTPISQEEWAALFKDHPYLFYNIDGIVHPCLLDMESAFYMPALTFNLFDLGIWNEATVPFFTNEYLLQTLKRFMCTLRTEPISCADGLLSAQRLKPGMAWTHRSIAFFARPRARRELEGNGWTFLHVISWHGTGNHYGFIKHAAQVESTVGSPTPGDASTEPSQIPLPETGPSSKVTYAVYDIKGFFEELAKEGRPPFDASDVAELTELFKNATINQPFELIMDPPPSGKLELISLEEAMNFVIPGKKSKSFSKYF